MPARARMLERSGALFCCMRSRDASRGGTAHATDMRVHAPHADAVRARHVRMLRLLFTPLQVRKNCELAITDILPTALLLLNRLSARYSIKHSCQFQYHHRKTVP